MSINSLQHTLKRSLEYHPAADQALCNMHNIINKAVGRLPGELAHLSWGGALRYALIELNQNE